MIRLLTIQPVAERGGSDQALVRMLRSLPAAEFECHVVVPAEPPLRAEFEACGAAVHVVPMERISRSHDVWTWAAYAAGWPVAVTRIAQLVRRLGIDVVHTNSLHSWYGWAAAAITRRPHVWHAREINVQSGLALRVEQRLTCHFATRVIAMSQAIANQLPDADVVVIHETVDAAEFSPARAGRFRGTTGITDDAPLVGFAGRIDTWKGVDVLLDAFPLVKEQCPDAQLVVAGGSVEGKEPYADALRVLAATMADVHWLGPRTDLPDVLADLDVFVMPSTEPEPYGLVAVEALASGTPVVMTDAGGPREIAVRAAPGATRLVPAGDASALADAVVATLAERGPSSAARRAARPVLRDPEPADRFAAEFLRVVEDHTLKRTHSLRTPGSVSRRTGHPSGRPPRNTGDTGVAMPSPTPVLATDEAARIIAERGFAARTITDAGAAGNGHRVGIELEWCTVQLDDPDRPADFAALCDAASGAVLPHGSHITFEPGGQVELSTAPLPGLDAVTAAAADADALGRSLAAAGIGMVAIGLEPGARRERCVRSPRYDAMEAYFDACGEAGRTMMRSTAALQLNVDLGDPAETELRWERVHDLGPVLTAMFANSPFRDGRPSGWKSTRSAVWQAIDPARTLPVADTQHCRDAWTRYAMDANVMLVRRSADDHVALPPGTTFGEWLARGHASGWPTPDDLDYHLTTLFPPIRPRGWLELRMMDAVGSPWWRVAAAVGTVLVDDPAAAATAADATVQVRGQWIDAARDGLDHPEIADAARECFRAARGALVRFEVDADTVAAAAEFEDRFVQAGRCPADELLDAYLRHGRLLPLAENAGYA